MKILIKSAAIIIFSLYGLQSKAQNPDSENFRQLAQRETKYMSQNLALDSNHIKIVINLEEIFFKKLGSIEKDLTIIERKEIIQRINDELNKELHKIFTPFQWDQYQKHIDERKQKLQEDIDRRRRIYHSKN